MLFWILHRMAQSYHGLWNLYTISHQLLQCSVFGSMASYRKLEFTAYRKKVVASMEQCTYDKKESQLVSACDIATQLKWSCTGQSGELSWVHYGNPKYKHSWGQMTSPWDLMDVIRSIITRPLSMVSLATDSPGNFGQGVVTLRLPSAIVESPWRHKRVPFVNIASVRSRLIKRRQWKHKMDYYGVVFAHLATGRGINAKDPSGLDSDRWIPHSRCCENQRDSPIWIQPLGVFRYNIKGGGGALLKKWCNGKLKRYSENNG